MTDVSTNQQAENKLSEYCSYTSNKLQQFERAENAASEISFKCVDCRNCSKCTNSDKIELISIKEEVEQEIINKSVEVDIHKGVAVTKLLSATELLSDPAIKLSPNKERALTVFKSQVKKLQKNDCDKEVVIASELKLQFLDMLNMLRI